MYAVCVTFLIKAGQMEAFLPLMLENAAASLRNEPGCHQFDVCREGDEVFLYELYDDRAAFEAHMQTPHFLSFDGAVASLVAEKTAKTFAWRVAAGD